MEGGWLDVHTKAFVVRLSVVVEFSVNKVQGYMKDTGNFLVGLGSDFQTEMSEDVYYVFS